MGMSASQAWSQRPINTFLSHHARRHECFLIGPSKRAGVQSSSSSCPSFICKSPHRPPPAFPTERGTRHASRLPAGSPPSIAEQHPQRIQCCIQSYTFSRAQLEVPRGRENRATTRGSLYAQSMTEEFAHQQEHRREHRARGQRAPRRLRRRHASQMAHIIYGVGRARVLRP